MTRIGSLFSGYGGLDMAVESVVGGTLAWYSEIEPAACKVLAAHHPGVPNLGDITTVDWSCVPPVDVITGGYPCQPFSHAGQRKGKADERHLYPYVSAAIDALRPQLVVLENVRGHLTLGFGDVLADLSRVGYDARWGVVRASDAGAPHGRARIFIVAYPTSKGCSGGFAVSDGRVRAKCLGHAGSCACESPAADAEGDEQRKPAEPRAVRAESRDGDQRPAADAVRERHDGLRDSDCEGSPGRGRADAAGHPRTSPDAASRTSDGGRPRDEEGVVGRAALQGSTRGERCTSPDAAISGSRAFGPQRASEARPAAGLGRDDEPPADAEGGGRGTRQGSPETAGGREVPRVGDSGEPAADPSSDEGWISNGDREPIADADSAGSEARINTGRDSERLWIQSVGHPAPPTDADEGGRGRRRQASGSHLGRHDQVDGGRRGIAPAGCGAIDWGKYAAAIARWESILGRPAPSPTTPGANGRPRLSPVFVEWMMSLPEGHVTGHGLRPAQELKLLGNGVVPVQAAMALRMLGVS